MRDRRAYTAIMSHAQTLSQVADIHEQAAHRPQCGETRSAYTALLRETLAQYRALIAEGLEVTFTDRDPYRCSADMRAAVARGTLQVYTESDMPADHFLARMSPYGVTFNALFRAVHDVYGHARTGAGFGPKGELQAYQAHSKMYSRAALPALAAETLAQNAWVNYGPHMREGKALEPCARPFAEQKAYAFPVALAEHFASVDMRDVFN